MPNVMSRKTRARVVLRTALGTALSSLLVLPLAARGVDLNKKIAFDIPAQDLSAALIKFSRQARLQVIVSDDLTGQTTRGVSGEKAIDQALNQLLEPAGLHYRVAGETAITVGGASDAETHASRAAPESSPIRIAQAEPTPSDERSASAGSRAALPPGAAEANTGGLEEVVVTAQLREQRVLDVPISMTVTSGEQLREANIGNLLDLSSRLPSIKIAQAPGAGLLNIRGLGSGNNVGFEQSVGTFVDGLYRGRSRAVTAALFDIERVEVLKGPQTTFFGNNAIAGALNISTVKPGPNFSYNASALYADDDGEYAVDAGVTLPLAENLSVRVVAKAYGMDGYSRNELLDDNEPHRDDRIVRASLTAQPSSRWEVDFRVDHGRNRDDGALANELINCPPPPPYPPAAGLCARYIASGAPVDDDFDYHSTKTESYMDYDFTEAGLTNRFDLGNWLLTATSGYFTHETDSLSVISPLPVPGVGGGASGYLVHFYDDVDQYSQEVRLQSQTEGLIDYMVGVYYAREELDAPTYVGPYIAPFGALAGPPYGPNTPVAAVFAYDQTTNTYSAFGSLAFKATDRLTLNLGARYLIAKKEIVRDLTYGAAAPLPSPEFFTPAPASTQTALLGILGGTLGNFPDPDRTDKKFMPSANLQYKLTEDIVTYASYSKGFKAGGFSSAFDRVEFGPESVDAYEAGLKANLFDRHVFLSVAAFRSEYHGLQEATQNILPSGVVVQSISNIAGARSQGVEFGANWHVNDYLSFTADVAYLDATFTSYKNAPCATLGNTSTCAQDMSGKRRPYAPEFSGNVGMSVTVPIDADIQARFDPSVYFSSSYYQSATADPLFEQSGYAKVDLRIGVGPADRSWEVAVLGKNLTDKKTASFRNGIASSPGSYFLLPERPRSIAIQFSIRH